MSTIKLSSKSADDGSNACETSREVSLSKFLTDPALTDILLEGTDGVRIPANRCLMAARSDVFYNMLLGGFSESTKRIIPIGYKGTVLQAIVEYVVTDRAIILEGADGDGDVDRIHSLVSLTGAAMYFGLPLLCQKAVDALSESLKKNPHLALPTFQAFQQERPCDANVKTVATSYLSFYSIEEVEKDAVSVLSASILEEILKDKECPIDEYHLFQILQVWAGEDDARKSLASDLVKHIKLEWIDPNLLCTGVAGSGLVSPSMLMEAYKNQALAAQAKDNRIFKRVRSLSVWKQSGLDTTTSEDMEGDLLDYSPMTSGVHTWTMELEEDAQASWFGVVLAGKTFDLGCFLGKQEGAWMLGSNGQRANGTQLFDADRPTFSQRSRVTLTLNLSEHREDGGCLEASIDGGNPFVVFDHMRDHLGEQGEGFLPAVSRPRRVRLLEITKLRN